MTTLTVETDIELDPRVGITLEGALAPKVAVNRVHRNGDRFPVRSMESVTTSLGDFFAWDYEAPHMEDIYYVAVVSEGTQLYRTNYARNPRPGETLTGWTWVNGTGGSGTSVSASSNDGPAGIENFARRTVSTADTGGSAGWKYTSDAVITGLFGDVITASMYVRSSVSTNTRVTLTFREAGADLSGETTSSSYVSLPANQWVRLSVTATSSHSYNGFSIWAEESTAGPASGATIDATAVLFEKSSELLPFFDGDTTPKVFYLNEWTGTYHASTSTMKYAVGATIATSDTVKLDVSQAWIKVPGLPALDMKIDLVSKPDSISRDRASSILLPFGARNPVAVMGPVQNPAMQIKIRTSTLQESFDFIQLLESTSGAFLLITPGWRYSWSYLAATGVSEEDVTPWRDPSLKDDTIIDYDARHVSLLTTWTLTCRTVSRPEGGISGDPSVSWQAVIDRYATWADLIADKASWLDLLRGVS